MCARRIAKAILLCTSILVLSAVRPDPSPLIYRFPMTGPDYILSGTFGELRPNHFHSGLDIKTGGEEGKPLHAVAPGYVYRIKVSPYGYGNAIYLRHTDGNFSVYGHMSRFSPAIEELLYQRQYASKRWEQEIYLNENDLPVLSGTLIGYSGNSGSSQGAHLHFEIRDEQERILNPLGFFRHLIQDDVPPILQTLALQPLSTDSRVAGAFAKLELSPQGRNGQYTLPGVVEVSGPFGVEYQGYDLLTGAGNHCGINYTKLFLDDRQIFGLQLDRFSFEEKKFINVHFDYAHHARTGRKLERCYVPAWNTFEAYRDLVDRGVIHLKDHREHTLRLELSDLHGNRSTVSLKVKSSPPPPLPRSFDDTELTTLEGQIQGDVFVAQLCHPSTGHLQGIDALLPAGQVRRIRPAAYQGSCLSFLLPLNQEPMPYALRDPITGKSVDIHLRRLIDPSRNMVVQEGEISVYFTEKSTFEPLALHLKRVPGGPGTYSDIYEVGTREVPLRSAFMLSLRPGRPCRPEHMVVAKRDARGRWTFLGKELHEDGSVYAATPSFGAFCVMADSTPPMVKPQNFLPGATIPASQDRLVMELRDDFSGIDSQRIHVTLDGKWILAGYDAKTNTIYHQIRYRPSPGPHEVEVMAYDQANNLGGARFTVYF